MPVRALHLFQRHLYIFSQNQHLVLVWIQILVLLWFLVLVEISKRVGNKTYYKIEADQLHEYKDIIDHMFKMAFVKCEYDGDCDNCPIKSKC